MLSGTYNRSWEITNCCFSHVTLELELIYTLASKCLQVESKLCFMTSPMKLENTSPQSSTDVLNQMNFHFRTRNYRGNTKELESSAQGM